MALVTVSDLRFSYATSGDPVFDHVSFQFDTDWRLGLIGRNGRGKTTFLKLLCGEYEYGGRISTPAAFRYFPPPVTDPGLGTLEVIDKINPQYEFWELCRELNRLEVPEETLFRPFQTLSFGERTKVLLAALFLQPDTFLLLDEPTNHLDVAGKALLAGYLAEKKGFLLVSHDRLLLDQTADHILSINRSDITVHKGGFSQWLEWKRQQDEQEAERNRQLQKEIGKLQTAARRTADWSHRGESAKYGGSADFVDRGYLGHKAAKVMKRAKALETRQAAAVIEKSQLLQNVEMAESLKLSPLSHHAAVLAALSGVDVAYDEKPVLRGLDFTLRQGERVALRGKNGSGKSTLLRLVAGDLAPRTGTVRLAGGLRISYLPQGTGHLSGDPARFAAEAGLDRTLFFAILRKLGLERIQFEKQLQEFSEGQKKKVLIAGSLSAPAHLYLWDEPLNYMDILSRMQIEALLLEYQPTMVFVEHDALFVQTIATRVFAMPDGQ